jgi:hypothetical protein
MSAPKRTGVFIVKSTARSPERDDVSRPAAPIDLPNHPKFQDHSADSRVDDAVLDPLSLIVRPPRIFDAFAIARMSTVLKLNNPEMSLLSYQPARIIASPLARWRRNRPHLLVGAAEGRLVAFAHWQPVLPDRRWQLVALGAATGSYDVEPIWEDLVRHSTSAAGIRGVKRLYAKIPLGSPAADSVEGVGFTAYASETVFLAEQIHSLHCSLTLREQEQTDTWAIHQLYNASVPKQVQFADAWTSHRWDLRSNRGSRRPITRGWLAEDGHQLVGYIRVTSQSNTHVIDLIYSPDHHQIVPEMLDGVVSRLRGVGKVGRFLCALRGYQVEAVSALSERGFDPVLEQDIYVKYTTASARVPQTEAIPFRVDVIERLPKRVPSFLHGKPGDGSLGS